MEFAERLKQWRKAKDYTQREAAFWLGVSRRSVEQWEQGRRAPRNYALRLLTSRLFDLIYDR